MRSVVDITLDVSVGVTGFAHLVCGLLIREGITTAAELGSELEKQARRISADGAEPNAWLLRLAKGVQNYETGGFGVIDGGKQD